MTAVARKMPEPCPYKSAKHQIPDEETGEGDHDWWQVKSDIWCRVCGADYNDESWMHVLFVRPPAPGQLDLFGRTA